MKSVLRYVLCVLIILSKFESAKKSLFQSVNGTLAVKQRLSLSNQ